MNKLNRLRIIWDKEAKDTIHDLDELWKKANNRK